ncbi:hypothetical protein [Sulfobacillus harzensis]|uniref:Uncharacterized protein n=1 Tax=Sulfobacillus harzensis TaxID=2729629 RepID=A0A7Y0L5R7_9FIRM|nr:hypothetical protein [Sulfobacillus harzensis]NMP23813.1 hypothetical protein [Sulfobacillus harzensis]
MDWTEIAEGVKAKVIDGGKSSEVLLLKLPSAVTAAEAEELIRALREASVQHPVILLPSDATFEAVYTGPSEVDRLAQRVHEAWMAEKQRQGYADHPRQIIRAFDAASGELAPDPDRPMSHRNFQAGRSIEVRPVCCDRPAEMHHRSMVPYDQLPEAAKDCDRAIVLAVLQALIEEDAP